MMTAYEISNGVIEDEERTGWELPCPQCNTPVKYTVLNVQPGEEVFLYNEKSADFVLRDEDALAAQQIRASSEDALLKALESIYNDLENHLAVGPNGGRFRTWSNVRCTHCGYEFPYNNGVRDWPMRLREGKVIWVEGAIAFRGTGRPSNRLARVFV